jgi:hypothetical protein
MRGPILPNLRTHINARARGRPTKLNVTVQVTICIALRRGATLIAACREAGVSLKTVCEWMARGRGEDPQRPRTKAYQAFGEAVQRAQDRAVHARFAHRRPSAFLRPRW